MMTQRYIALAAAFAAALTLAACGDDEPTDDTTPVEDAAAPAIDEGAPAMDAGAPAMDAGAPAMDAGAPAMDAGAPAMDAAAPAATIVLTDLVGQWAETAEACATDAITIAPDAFATADGACIVTGVEEGEAGLNVELLCPVADAEPTPTTWTIAATGEAPYTAINITEGETTTAYVLCTTE